MEDQGLLCSGAPHEARRTPKKKRDKARANKAGCERGAAVYSSVWYDFKVLGAISPRGCMREPRQALAIKSEGRNCIFRNK